MNTSSKQRRVKVLFYLHGKAEVKKNHPLENQETKQILISQRLIAIHVNNSSSIRTRVKMSISLSKVLDIKKETKQKPENQLNSSKMKRFKQQNFIVISNSPPINITSCSTQTRVKMSFPFHLKPTQIHHQKNKNKKIISSRQGMNSKFQIKFGK